MLRRIFWSAAGRSDITNQSRKLFTTRLSYKKKEASEKTEPCVPELITYENQGPLALIGINRPECRNAINAVAAGQLCEAINKFENDKNSLVGVLYGIGGSFCSGYDLEELAKEGNKTDIIMTAEGSVGPTRRHMKKPIVCGISGYCVANGLELALMCDLRVMEDSAVLGFYNRRIGVPTVDGGTARLAAMIGISRALDLILTGRKVTAKEAGEIGIANRIVATGTALGQAVNLALSIAKFPQAALLHDRLTILNSVYDSPSFEASMQNEIMCTSKEVLQEMEEGVKMYQEGYFREGKSDFPDKKNSMADWEIKEAEHEKDGEKSDKDDPCETKDTNKENVPDKDDKK